MGSELLEYIELVRREKGVALETLFEVIESAILAAARKNSPNVESTRVNIDRTSGEIHLFARKRVVDVVSNEDEEISKAEVLAENLTVDEENNVELEIGREYLGRVPAQTAKQVVLQRIREVEREKVFNEFKEREGDLITGIVQRFEFRNVVMDIGTKVEALIPAREVPHGVRYHLGERLRCLVLEVRDVARGYQIILSRSDPRLVTLLFTQEVPEISEGIVEIKAVAREAGERTKIAVHSNELKVDPVGACVGMKGTRVQNVVMELGGEKIDIVEWSEDPVKLINNSLNPAKITNVLVDIAERKASVIVPDSQLSLAIGKKGQNARLTAKLTNWKVDIKSETQAKKEQEEEVSTAGVDRLTMSTATLKERKEITSDRFQAKLEDIKRRLIAEGRIPAPKGADETADEDAEDKAETDAGEPKAKKTKKKVTKKNADEVKEEPETEASENADNEKEPEEKAETKKKTAKKAARKTKKSSKSEDEPSDEAATDEDSEE